MSKQLSIEQKYAFDKFCRGENMLISGSGGTGKSEMVRVFVEYMTKNKMKFQVTSTTGCSCVLLSNNIKIEEGKQLSVKTINSWSGIKLCNGPDDIIIEKVLGNYFAKKSWKQINILIIDEVSMMSCKIFTILENIARLARNNNRPFGGMQVILLGDFLQLPPIADSADIESGMFAFESTKWRQVIPLQNHIELKTIFRQTDNVFREILNEIRIGHLSPKNNDILQNRVGIVYNPEEHNGIIPIRIMSTRAEVNRENIQEYNKIKGKEHIFQSKNAMDRKTYADNEKPFSLIDIEICAKLTQQQKEMELNRLKSLIPINETIELKIGVPVMILVNLDIENSISNGSLGMVVDIVSNIPIIQFKNGKKRAIGPHVWQNPDAPCITITQLPLVLAYASTIHKQQGASIDFARMNLGKSIFEVSQIYVALSRVTSLQGLFLDAFDPSKIKVNTVVTNFYKQFPNIQGKYTHTFYPLHTFFFLITPFFSFY